MEKGVPATIDLIRGPFFDIFWFLWLALWSFYGFLPILPRFWLDHDKSLLPHWLLSKPPHDSDQPPKEAKLENQTTEPQKHHRCCFRVILPFPKDGHMFNHFITMHTRYPHSLETHPFPTNAQIAGSLLHLLGKFCPDLESQLRHGGTAVFGNSLNRKYISNMSIAIGNHSRKQSSKHFLFFLSIPIPYVDKLWQTQPSYPPNLNPWVLSNSWIPQPALPFFSAIGPKHSAMPLSMPMNSAGWKTVSWSEFIMAYLMLMLVVILVDECISKQLLQYLCTVPV